MNRKIKLALMHDGSDEEGLSAVLIKWASEVIAQRAEFEPRVIELADLVTSPDAVRLGRRHESLRYLAKAVALVVQLYLFSTLRDYAEAGFVHGVDQVGGGVTANEMQWTNRGFVYPCGRSVPLYQGRHFATTVDDVLL